MFWSGLLLRLQLRGPTVASVLHHVDLFFSFTDICCFSELEIRHRTLASRFVFLSFFTEGQPRTEREREKVFSHYKSVRTAEDCGSLAEKSQARCEHSKLSSPSTSTKPSISISVVDSGRFWRKAQAMVSISCEGKMEEFRDQTLSCGHKLWMETKRKRPRIP